MTVNECIKAAESSITGAKVLEPSRFVVSHSIKTGDPEKFHEIENE